MSCFKGFALLFGKQRKRVRPVSESRLHKCDVPTPCVCCDRDTLLYVNASAANKRNHVTISFRMKKHCTRCSDVPLMERLFACCEEEVDVKLAVDQSSFGLLQRAVEASGVATKGSEYRSHGTLVSHLTTLEAPELLKISMLRWLPFAMNLLFEGQASFSLPHTEEVEWLREHNTVEKGADVSTVHVMPKSQWHGRVAVVLKRLKRLRGDEVLTESGAQLLRQEAYRSRLALENLMVQKDTDDVFKLGLVKFTSDGPKPENSTHEEVLHNPETPDRVISSSEMLALQTELLQLRSTLAEVIRGHQQEAEVSSDVDGSASETSLGDTPRARGLDDVVVTRAQFLALRPSCTDDPGLGYAVAVPRKARRALRVARRAPVLG